MEAWLRCGGLFVVCYLSRELQKIPWVPPSLWKSLFLKLHLFGTKSIVLMFLYLFLRKKDMNGAILVDRESKTHALKPRKYIIKYKESK